jgi:hypothetical protein
MNEPPRRNRDQRLPLSPGIQNALEGQDEMMTIGPVLFCLGLSAIILLVVVILIL